MQRLLLGGDITRKDDYPFCCWPAAIDTFLGAVSIDAVAGATIDHDGVATRWYEDSNDTTAAWDVEVIDWATADWLVEVWVGTSCEDVALVASLTADHNGAAIVGTAGLRRWFRVRSDVGFVGNVQVYP